MRPTKSSRNPSSASPVNLCRRLFQDDVQMGRRKHIHGHGDPIQGSLFYQPHSKTFGHVIKMSYFCSRLQELVSPLVYFLAFFGVAIPEPFVIISQAMDGIYAIINVITHLKNIIMRKIRNLMDTKKKRKTILMSVQTVLEVGGLE